MTNRRQFLGMGIAAAVWPGWMTAFGRPSLTGGPVEEPARLPLYKAIYDTDYASAVEFAAQMRRRGVVVHAIERDITSVWFNDLALQWRQRPVAIAGLTAPAALFCLEQLAWDHRMRVVFRATHALASDGTVEHRVRAPQALLPRVADTLGHSPGWGASMAELAVHCGQDQTRGSGDVTAATRGGDRHGLPLVSWVIAPVDRA